MTVFLSSFYLSNQSCYTTSITITKICKFVLRQRGEDVALEVIAHMEQGKIGDYEESRG